MPRSDAAGPDATETAIVLFFEEEQGRCLIVCDQQLKAYAESIGVLDSNTAVAQITGEVRRAKGECSTLIINSQNRLHTARSKTTHLAEDLDLFKKKHRIRREPRYPESTLWHWGILGGFVVAETAFNGYMFSIGNPYGLLGGATQAAFFASGNVAVGYFAGRLILPNVWHRNWVRLIAGLFGCALFFGVALFFNLAVGHYRDEIALPPYDDVARRALVGLLARPFGLIDLTSWMLFGFGVLFNIGAMIDAWKMDDRYPGYGLLHREAELAHQDYTNATGAFHVDARGIRDSSLERIEQIAKRATINMNQQQILARRSEHLRNAFLQHQSYLELCCQTLLGEYRSANEQHRHTQSPQHFARSYQMRYVSLPPVTLLVSPALAGTVQSAHEDINEAYDRAISAFETVRTLTTV
jgi:hypothetical protein